MKPFAILEKINSTLTLTTSFEPCFLTALKSAVPSESRDWNGTWKRWELAGTVNPAVVLGLLKHYDIPTENRLRNRESWVTISYCPSSGGDLVTVHQHQSKGAAEKALKLMSSRGCGGRCEGNHELAYVTPTKRQSPHKIWCPYFGRFVATT